MKQPTYKSRIHILLALLLPAICVLVWSLLTIYHLETQQRRNGYLSLELNKLQHYTSALSGFDPLRERIVRRSAILDELLNGHNDNTVWLVYLSELVPPGVVLHRTSRDKRTIELLGKANSNEAYHLLVQRLHALPGVSRMKEQLQQADGKVSSLPFTLTFKWSPTLRPADS